VAPTLRSALARLSSRFNGALVFCRSDGKPIDPDNFVHRVWARVLRRAELRRIRFHDLRHTYASLLIAQGAHPKYIWAHPKYIQAQLGHASIQTTLDRYGHLMPDAHAGEARKLDRLVFGENGRHTSDVVADAVQRVQNGCRNVEGVSGSDR
jgi:integrase